MITNLKKVLGGGGSYTLHHPLHLPDFLYVPLRSIFLNMTSFHLQKIKVEFVVKKEGGVYKLLHSTRVNTLSSASLL